MIYRKSTVAEDMAAPNRFFEDATRVAGGAMVECEFDGDNGFAYPPPSGFSGIVASRSLM